MTGLASAETGPRRRAGGIRRTGRVAGRVVALVWHKTFEDRILGLAAEAGFWALVSLPATLLAVFGALGYLRGIIGAAAINQVRHDVLRAASDVLTSGTVNSDVAPILDQVLSRGHLEVVSIGFVISMWSGSTVMSDYLNTITVAYGMRGLRSAWRSRLVALWLYVLALLAGVVLLPALALGPNLITRIFPGGVHDEVSTTVHIAYWPVVAVGSVALLAFVYKACLPVRVRWHRGLPGATIGMGLWVLFSFVVRAFLTSSLRQRSAYGSLSAPIAGLLFFYFTALAVLLGAEVNSALDAVWPVASTAEGRERSERQAEAAREMAAATTLEAREAITAAPGPGEPRPGEPGPGEPGPGEAGLGEERDGDVGSRVQRAAG